MIKCCILAVTLSTSLLVGAQSEYIDISNMPRGSRLELTIPVSDGGDSTFIPITIFKGMEEGPTLGITAGVHGFEYPPIMAAQRMTRSLDPKEMKGNVILVQIANVPSFIGRSPFVNPLDDKNLNRSFPGSADGSVTDQIANDITRHVIAQSDYFIDMHGGDASEDLAPYNAYYRSDTFEEASQKGMALALAMGFDHVVVFDVPNKRVRYPSLYCSQEAFHRKIPAVDIECGGLGQASDRDIDQIENALLRALIHLQILPGENTPTPGQLIIGKRQTIRSTHTGIFYPLKESADYIAEGMKIGYITDFFGNVQEEVFADVNGIILYIIGTPPVKKGETIASIGLLVP